MPTEIKLKNPTQFGEKILDYFLEQGWQSLSKRDLELLMFLLLEQDGAIQRLSPAWLDERICPARRRRRPLPRQTAGQEPRGGSVMNLQDHNEAKWSYKRSYVHLFFFQNSPAPPGT